MLAEDTTEHREFYENDCEAFFYASDRELIQKANVLLDLSAESVSAIRAAARIRSVKSSYSYVDRAKQVKAAIQQCLNKQ